MSAKPDAPGPTTPSRFVATLRRAAGLERQDWRFLVVATKELALARLRHATTRVGAIFDDLQRRSVDSEGKRRAAGMGPAELRRLSWAIAAAAARVPWRSDCLLQAMAAQRWLRREGFQAEFFVGVRKDPGGDLLAHAWLTRDGLTITGGAHEAFHVLVASEPPTSRPADDRQHA